MQPDFFTSEMAMRKSGYIVAVTKSVTLQTIYENYAKEIKRGIYGFKKFSLAKHFTKACNDANGDDVAYFFRCNKRMNKPS